MEARAAGSSAGLVHRFGRRAVDAYETAVLVRASIRERTVLL
jgi:hypothetical protein